MDLEAGVPANTSTLPPAVRRESSRVNGNLSSVNASADESHTNDVHQSIEGQTSVEFVPPIEGTPAALALAANAAIKMSRLEKNLQKIRAIRRPKMKSLNIVKRINKTTKAKRKKHFSKNFKGKVIDGLHELYTLTAGMMLGIRYSADRVANFNHQLQKTDFEQLEIVSFPPKGNTTPPYITPPHSLAHTFEFKSYAPKVFKNIRNLFDIDTPSYMYSVCGDYNFIEFISNSKSGQFFFYSHDGKYMLKTQTKEEKRFMQKILPSYYEYIKANPNTLLVRILGMHRIKMYHLRRKVHFVIMGSVFDSPVKINTIYDLKGSLHGRRATEKERASGGVLKDQDMLDDKRKLHLGKKKPAFMLQLRKDAQFLADNHIMDYSLLIGIHDRNTRGQVESVNLTPNGVSSTTEQGPQETPVMLSATENHSSSNNNIHVPHVQTSSTSIAVTARPHSNTPFRRSLHEALNAQQLLAVTSSANHALDGDGKPRRSTSITKSTAGAGVNADDLQSHNGSTTTSNAPNSIHATKDHSTTSVFSSQSTTIQQQQQQQSNQQQQQSPAGGQFTQPLSLSVHDDDFEAHEHEHENDEEYDDENESDQENENDDVENEEEYEDIDEGDSDLDQPQQQQVTSGSSTSSSYCPSPPRQGKSQGLPRKLSDRQLTHTQVMSIPVRSASQPVISSTLSSSSSVPQSSTLHHPPSVGEIWVKPWTSRIDGGINSHTRQGRGNEIYFVGIIDILQEYNYNKRMETVFKGLTNDVRQISSVDPLTYAHRFVKFMEDNID